MEDLRRSTAGAPPLHTGEISRLAIPNRIFAAVYTVALLFLFYHHFTTLITFLPLTTTKSQTSFFASLLLLAADTVLAFKWTTTQSFRMRPLRRTESPELLQNTASSEDFPAIDVFICTADPYKEPPVVVVNTVLSVMAYEYPQEKISVYVSDDGGSALTLFALFEAAKFAVHWLPFCRYNAVVDRSPEAFFAANSSGVDQSLCPEAEEIKNLYEKMKVKIENVVERGKVSDEYINNVDDDESRVFRKWTNNFTRQNHPAVIQVVMHENKYNDLAGYVIPNLIYVSREKSESSIHHFKAGALNVLMRVSATMTNAPIILTLDCDTYSNDPQTPLRALCYFSDPKVQSDTAFVQFPQRFKGINKNDIYGGQLKRLYVINAQGMDGLLGSCYVGTGCFFNRRAFFGGPNNLVLPELRELGPKNVVSKRIYSDDVLKLAHTVAGCNYESKTLWGYKIGVRYGSLSEDYNTGYQLQCEGWKSIFCNPKRAAFYGDSPSSLFDVLSQNKRWALGLLMVTFSKYNPITYGIGFLGPLMGLSYAYYAYWPTLCFPIIIYAFLPQLALLNGITLFTKVSEPWFILYLFLFFGAYGQDCLDFLIEGGTVQRWWNDQRMWLIRGLSSYLFGSIEYFSKTIGISSFGFNVTSKVNDEEQRRRYEKGVFEFGVHSPLFVTLTMAAITNFVALFWGLIMILRGQNDFEKLSMQLLIAVFAVINSRPIYEAFFVRSDKGGISTKTILVSTILVASLFAIAFVTF